MSQRKDGKEIRVKCKGLSDHVRGCKGFCKGYVRLLTIFLNSFIRTCTQGKERVSQMLKNKPNLLKESK